MAEQIYSLHFLREFTKAVLFNFIPRDELEIIERTEPILTKENQAEESVRLIPSYPAVYEPQSGRFFVQRTRTNPKIFIKQPQRVLKQEIRHLDLGKIQTLIDDLSVASVDCPGPGKIVSARKMNSIIHTKIMLNKEEINDIINLFSQQSRIPRIGGFFKAVVDNLMINSVDSGFGSPRFMITKMNKPFNAQKNF
ncbi:MAG: hypothetical protein WC533_02615 [Candidatus Pacearchaeota archaeon]